MRRNLNYLNLGTSILQKLGEKHDFANVNNYLNEHKIDINKLTSDDLKLISMIFIWFFDFFYCFFNIKYVNI